jgi:hypothetical protein
MKTEKTLYIRILIWAYNKQEDGFTWDELKKEFSLTQNQSDWVNTVFREYGNELISILPYKKDHIYTITAKGTSAAISYLNLKEAERSGKRAEKIAWVAIIISLVALYSAIMLGQNQIEVSREQIQNQNAIWDYEQMRNDRIEARDIQWRKADLQFQDRLPE